MPCPNSPEPDGYHRYAMAAQGEGVPTTYITRCLHCGAAKQMRPFDEPTTAYQASLRKATAARNAARRQKREAQP